MVNVNHYEKECVCIYKEERYSVRDNGAVLRHPHHGKRPRPTDNNWTFGRLNNKTGYLEMASVRIHRIVATAFHGEPPTKEHVVDHIDTNKQNNRTENLRWVTRLENILLNPITARRIELVCGSVEAFLANPSKFRDNFPDPNYQWMCAVSPEDAQVSLERMLAWANSDKPLRGGSLGEWIFSREIVSTPPVIRPNYIMSKTPNAVQDWKTPSEFPCCPQGSFPNPISTYFDNLKKGEVFSRNEHSTLIAFNYEVKIDGSTLWIIGEATEIDAIKRWYLVQVTFEDNTFVHANLGSFFEQIGVEKQFTLVQGLEWTGPDSIDDFC